MNQLGWTLDLQEISPVSNAKVHGTLTINKYDKRKKKKDLKQTNTFDQAYVLLLYSWCRQSALRWVLEYDGFQEWEHRKEQSHNMEFEGEELEE